MDLRSGLNLTVTGLVGPVTSRLGLSVSDLVKVEVGDLHAEVSGLWSKKWFAGIEDGGWGRGRQEESLCALAIIWRVWSLRRCCSRKRGPPGGPGGPRGPRGAAGGSAGTLIGELFLLPGLGVSSSRLSIVKDFFLCLSSPSVRPGGDTGR